MPRPRHTVPQVGPTSERRDTRQYQNGFAGAPSGGADGTAIGVWHTPPGEQSAHRRSGKPGAPSHRQANPGGPVLPRREAGGTTWGAVCGIMANPWLSAVSCQPSAFSCVAISSVWSTSPRHTALQLELSAVSHQLSAVSCRRNELGLQSPAGAGHDTKSSFRLSAISVQLSAMSVRLPVPRRGIRRLKLGRPLSSVIRVSR